MNEAIRFKVKKPDHDASLANHKCKCAIDAKMCLNQGITNNDDTIKEKS